MGKLLRRVQGMQLHGSVKTKLLMTEKDNSVMNVLASLSLVHKHWLDSSTGKDKVTKDHTEAPRETQVLPNGITWRVWSRWGQCSHHCCLCLLGCLVLELLTAAEAASIGMLGESCTRQPSIQLCSLITSGRCPSL